MKTFGLKNIAQVLGVPAPTLARHLANPVDPDCPLILRYPVVKEGGRWVMHDADLQAWNGEVIEGARVQARPDQVKWYLSHGARTDRRAAQEIAAADGLQDELARLEIEALFRVRQEAWLDLAARAESTFRIWGFAK